MIRFRDIPLITELGKPFHTHCISGSCCRDKSRTDGQAGSRSKRQRETACEVKEVLVSIRSAPEIKTILGRNQRAEMTGLDLPSTGWLPALVRSEEEITVALKNIACT